MPVGVVGDAGELDRRHHRELHPGRHAPERRRLAAAPRGIQPVGHGRLRHRVSPREHDDAQARRRAGRHGRHRGGDVRPPGGAAVLALHGGGRPDGPDARRPEAQARTLPRMRFDARGLALVGMRGTGKSTVGRILASRLSRPFLDADDALEARVGRPIASLFAREGERYFRDWEERILAELTAGHPRAILATGGGAVLREANRRALRSFGFVVWLRADPRVASARLSADARDVASRPALTAAGTLEEMADVLEARSPLYREVADAVVDTSGHAPDAVADAILASWREAIGEAREA